MFQSLDDIFTIDLHITHNICCLCGFDINEHYKKRHTFICCYDMYRCKKCNRFYYQHSHEERECLFVPYKYIR